MLASGFANAPTTRFLVLSAVALSLLVSITDTKPYIPIAVQPHILSYSQFWRFLTWQICWTNSTEVLFGAMALYQLRVIERLWGTRKLISFLLATAPYTTLLPPLLLLVLRPPTGGWINVLPAGPTAIVFALLAQFHVAVPYMYKYRLSAPGSASEGLNLTSKSTSYLLPMQLALSQLPGSAIVAGVGWLVGYAYRREILPGAGGWRVPVWRGQGEKRYDEVRRRMRGEVAAAGGSASGSGREGTHGEERRRTIGGQLLDQFRGAS